MSEIKKDNTEEKILNAAQKVFLIKGMEGSRMQEIANEAGINKALLHYYFRTKEKLFEAIFSKVFSNAFPSIHELLLSNLSIEEKIEKFIDKYISLLLHNPFLPAFIIKEINRDPKFFINTVKNQGLNLDLIFEVIEKEMLNGKIRRMDPKDLVVNMFSLSLFPFAAKPVLSSLLFDGNKKAYSDFLQKRKESVKDFILNSILIK